MRHILQQLMLSSFECPEKNSNSLTQLWGITGACLSFQSGILSDYDIIWPVQFTLLGIIKTGLIQILMTCLVIAKGEKWVTGFFPPRACLHFIMCNWCDWPWSLVCVTVDRERRGPPCPQALVTVVYLWKRLALVFTAGGSHCNKDALNGAQKDQMCLCSLGIKKHLG